MCLIAIRVSGHLSLPPVTALSLLSPLSAISLLIPTVGSVRYALCAYRIRPIIAVRKINQMEEATIGVVPPGQHGRR